MNISELLDENEALVPDTVTAQDIVCPCCGLSHTLEDCEQGNEMLERDEIDYFGFQYNKPLRF